MWDAFALSEFREVVSESRGGFFPSRMPTETQDEQQHYCGERNTIMGVTFSHL